MAEENKCSLSILSDQWKANIDNGHEQLIKLEDAYIEAVKQMAKQLDRNQMTYREFLEQIKNEQQDWERRMREEFLTATSGMHFLFPFQSLEKINNMFEKAMESQNNIPSALNFSFVGKQDSKKAMEWIEKNVAIVRKSRERYLEALKKTASSVIEQQQNYVNTLQEQMKQCLFPFQAYIDKHKAN